MIGVDYDLFWTLNPKSLTPFNKAFILKQKYDDTVAWEYGNYVRLAILSCFDKEQKYPSKQLLSDISPEDFKNKLKKKTEEDIAIENQLKIKQKMIEKMKLLNTRFQKGG